MLAARHFTMGALNAVLAIRRHLSAYPSVDPFAAVASIRSIDADFAASDFEAGLDLHSLLPNTISFGDPVNGLREAIFFLVMRHRPIWCRQFRLGRRHVQASLERDELQCFRAAGLLDEPPSKEASDWWDDTTQALHAIRNAELLAQARIAERLSLDHERKRLGDLGISLEPEWIAIEDNTVGYDIRSYDPGPVQPVNRLIEVKSSTANPPSVILTRNEWRIADSTRGAYRFHFWDLKNEVLYERTVEEVEPHIPLDRGSGAWKSVEIALKVFRRSP